MWHWLKLKYISWDWHILSETEILCLRPRHVVWDENTLSETYKWLLPLQFHSIYSLPLCTLFSVAINFFPPSRLLNLLAVYSITLSLLPLLPKSLSLSTARLSSPLIYYNTSTLTLYGFRLPSLRHRKIRRQGEGYICYGIAETIIIYKS